MVHVLLAQAVDLTGQEAIDSDIASGAKELNWANFCPDKAATWEWSVMVSQFSYFSWMQFCWTSFLTRFNLKRFSAKGHSLTDFFKSICDRPDTAGKICYYLH